MFSVPEFDKECFKPINSSVHTIMVQSAEVQKPSQHKTEQKNQQRFSQTPASTWVLTPSTQDYMTNIQQRNMP
jgi:hypothetical protein